MSDYKPITGEMRKYVGIDRGVCYMDQESFDRLCDAIDAEHERENAELKAKLDRVQGEQEDHRSCIYYDPERHYCSCHDIDTDGMVELPKDADGVTIHAGDVLDGYGKTIEVVELRHGRSRWVLISRDGNGYADTFAFTHHAPTVEDVLREFALKVAGEECMTMRTGVVEEYASKLRLAGDAE